MISNGTSIATMLLSDQLSKELNIFMNQEGDNIKTIFRSLLDEFASMVISFQPTSSDRLKKEYQSSGRVLIKRNMRLYDSDIEEFRIIADYLRMSKCKLFALLLEWKLIGWGRILKRVGFVRTPTHHLTLSLSTTTKPTSFRQNSKIRLML